MTKQQRRARHQEARVARDQLERVVRLYDSRDCFRAAFHLGAVEALIDELTARMDTLIPPD